MGTRVRSYSKINLGLRIGPVRADGFHALVTLYQTLALHDFVTVEVRVSGGGERGEEPAVGRERRRFWTAKDAVQNDEPKGGTARGEANDDVARDEAAKGTVGDEATMGAAGRAAATGTAGREVGMATLTSATKITLTTNDARVPTDARNTAWKMVELALERMGVEAEVAIHIEKELPVQGGMGAGSANAAAALIGLERELGWALPEAERLAIAAEVGSDVPLFLVGGAVLGVGRGEVVSAMAVDLPETWCVVAVPEVGVSTPRAFRDWDEKSSCQLSVVSSQLTVEPTSQGRDVVHSTTAALRDQNTPEELTSTTTVGRLEELSHAYASVLGNSTTEVAPDASGIVRGPSPESKQGSEQSLIAAHVEQGSTLNGLAGNPLLALVRTGIENDFEQVVFPQYPTLREIKRLLMGSSAGVSRDDSVDLSGDAMYAALSGSGSALFGLYESESDARAAQRRVQASGCKAILTKTLPRQEYWSNMFAE